MDCFKLLEIASINLIFFISRGTNTSGLNGLKISFNSSLKTASISGSAFAIARLSSISFLISLLSLVSNASVRIAFSFKSYGNFLQDLSQPINPLIPAGTYLVPCLFMSAHSEGLNSSKTGRGFSIMEFFNSDSKL
jgi:hypothetical protein